ncbi:MAG: hypothetical protein WC374_04635 [Phycisphaerae bacterium]|jgi:hypothetical protein
MEYKKPEKLSTILARSEKEFAEKVTKIVDENYDEFQILRDKCWSNERVWRNRHWDEKAFKDKTDERKARPNVPMLHSTVENIIADIMDNYPDQIIRGVNYDDDMRSVIATELVRFIFQRAKYPTIYEKKARASVKTGTGIARPYWNPELDNGMGDIDFEYLHIDNVVWDKRASDVNKGRFFAIVSWVDPDDVYDMYPDIDLNKALPEDEGIREVHTNNTEDTRLSEKEGRVRVILYMWKEKAPRMIEVVNENGVKEEKQMGHITFVNSAVVIGEAVRDEHIGQYEYDRYFISMAPYLSLEGEPFGLSIIDLFQDDADIVNLIEKEFVANLQASSNIRYLVNRTAGINETELKDLSKPIVHGNSIHDGAVRETKPVLFSSQALNYKNAKMAEVKEQSGQTDFNIGQGGSGVTSGIGIQSLQQYGAKRSRLTIRHFNEQDHKDVVKDVLKLAQAHYKTERVIRLSRETQDQVEKTLKKAQEAIAAAQQQGAEGQAAPPVLPEGVKISGNEMTIDFSMFSLDYLDLDYDIEIIPQRKSPATSDAINSVVSTLANSKQIDGETALELIEFEGKDQIMRKIRERNDINAKMQQMAQQTQQAIEAAQQAAEVAQQQAKQIEKLKDDVWAEKLKVIVEKYLNKNESGTGEEGGQAPETFEQAIGQLKSEILGEGQGQASA